MLRLLGSVPACAQALLGLLSLTLLLGRVAPAGQPRRLQHTPPRLPDALVALTADHFPGLFQIQQVADREVLFGLQVVQVRRDRVLQAVWYRGLPVHYMCIARSHDAREEQRGKRRRGCKTREENHEGTNEKILACRTDSSASSNTEPRFFRATRRICSRPEEPRRARTNFSQVFPKNSYSKSIQRRSKVCPAAWERRSYETSSEKNNMKQKKKKNKKSLSSHSGGVTSE